MAKIRSVKPEFFRHFDLYTAEKKYGLPLRLSFAGLWTCADREGRFKWQPKQLKLDVLPYDEDVDFDKVMEALLIEGYLAQYTVDNKQYGWIISFAEHQRVRSDEAQSTLPAPPSDTGSSRPRTEVVKGSNGSNTTSNEPERVVQKGSKRKHSEISASVVGHTATPQNINHLQDPSRTRNEVVSNQHRGNGNGNELNTSTLSSPLNPPTGQSENEQQSFVTNQTAEQPVIPPPAAPQTAGLTRHEVSFQRAGNDPLRLSFFLDESYLSREILALLNGSMEQMCMIGDLYKRPDNFLKFLFEYFIAETLAKGQDLTAGRLRIEFTNMISYRLKSVEKFFNESQKDDQWFEKEFQKHVPKDWPKQEKDKFRIYFTTALPSGKKYYQTVNNFVMENAVQTWASNNSVGEKNLHTQAGRRRDDKPTHVVAGGGMSIDEQKDYYGLKK